MTTCLKLVAIGALLTLLVGPASAAQEHHGPGVHHHGPVEVVHKDMAPSVKLIAVKDAKGEWDLEVRVSNFTFAPTRVNTAYAEGEGHAHLYVDGVKQRLYCPFAHLGRMSPGKHTLRVTLNGNDHSEMSLDGKIIEDSLVVEQ